MQLCLIITVAQTCPVLLIAIDNITNVCRIHLYICCLGHSCVSWSSIDHDSDSLLKMPTFTSADNFCRNPDNSSESWCYISQNGTKESCAIPRTGLVQTQLLSILYLFLLHKIYLYYYIDVILNRHVSLIYLSVVYNILYYVMTWYIRYSYMHAILLIIMLY